MRTTTLGALAAAAILSTAVPGVAQERNWSGPYLAADGGYGFRSDDSAETVRFDKNLDGNFTDTILTAAGANAFSPGFCGGGALGTTPARGCQADHNGSDLGG